jgi:hypothetical protein
MKTLAKDKHIKLAVMKKSFTILNKSAENANVEIGL